MGIATGSSSVPATHSFDYSDLNTTIRNCLNSLRHGSCLPLYKVRGQGWVLFAFIAAPACKMRLPGTVAYVHQICGDTYLG